MRRPSCSLLLLLLRHSSGQIDDEPDSLPSAMAPARSATSCKYTSKGVVFDLGGMLRTDHDFTGTTPGGYTYRFNVCGGTVKVCNGQQGPASKWRGTKCNNLGDLGTQEISLLKPSEPRKGLKLSYRDGDICKKQVNGEMEIASRQVPASAVVAPRHALRSPAAREHTIGCR